MMIPLLRFITRRGATELHLCPNGRRWQEQGTDVLLPLEGAAGRRDDAFSPAGAVSPLLAFQDEESQWDIIEPLRLQENVDYDFVVIVPMTARAFAIGASASGDPVYPFANSKLKNCVSFNSTDSCAELPGGLYRLSGRLRFDNYLGPVDLSIRNDVGELGVRAEVTSNKLDYEADFSQLLRELGAVHAELILNLDAPTEVSLHGDDATQQSPHALLLHLRRLFQRDGLPVAVATILGNPLSRHKSVRRVDETAFVVHPDYTELQFKPHSLDWVRGGQLASMFCGFTPNTLPTIAIETNYDVIENRFVKHSLKEVMRILQSVKHSLPRQYQASHRRVKEWIAELDALLIHPFWHTVGECTTFPSSMVMHERHGYRDVIQHIMLLDRALAMHATLGQMDSTDGDLRPIWELYEMWCYFQLRTVLRELTGRPGQPTLESMLRASNYSLDLVSGHLGRTTFDYKSTKGRTARIELFYTNRFKECSEQTTGWDGSYSTLFKPDFSVKICLPDRCHWIHFDAKYRVSFLNRKEAGLSDVGGEGGGFVRSFRSEDLNVMHAYRDAILGTRGCYILYPGNTCHMHMFVRHHDPCYRREQPGPSVGAFPLCPSGTETFRLQLDQLQVHLGKMIAAIVECDTYCEEEGFSRAATMP